MSFKEGDKVQYVGVDEQVQQDYGRTVLTVVMVDPVTELTACKEVDGRLIVGIPSIDLERVRITGYKQ
jgi:hypothetical protein